MPEYAVLTKDQCPKCDRLKEMLAKPLRGQFDDRIEIVHYGQHTAEFNALAQRHGILGVPVIIRHADQKVLTNCDGLGDVKKFLSVTRG